MAKIYYKYLTDWDEEGKIIKKKCVHHTFIWSGKTPCTGTLKCIFCGKPKDD